MKVRFPLIIILFFTILFSCKDDEYDNPVDTSLVITAPSELNITFSADTMVTLGWQHSMSSELEFIAEISDNDTTWSELGRIEKNNSLQVKYNFITGKTYSFRVRAAMDENQSAVITQQASIVLDSPSELIVNFPSDTLVVLSWSDNSTFETGFEIEKSLNGTNYSLAKSVGENIETIEIDGEYLVNTTYSFRVRAKTALNYSNYSEASYSSPSEPTAPSNLAITFSDDTHAELSWTDNTDGELGYEIEKSVNNGDYIKALEIGSNKTSCVIEGQYLTASIYSFRIRSKTSVNYSAYSNLAEGSPVLPAPSTLQVIFENDTKAILSWTDNSSYENGFEIEMSEDGFNYNIINNVSANTTVTEINNIFSHSKIYSFRVRAITNYNQSMYSMVISCGLKPVKPELLTPDNNSTNLSSTPELTWRNSDGADTYTLQVSTTNAFTSFVYNQDGLRSTSQEVTGLSNLIKYYWRVRAANGFSTSDWSDVRSFTIPATLVLQPDAESGKDAHFSLAAPNDNRGLVSYIAPYAWTQAGTVNISRDLIQFDVAELGNNAMIESAFLYLYFSPIDNMNLMNHSGDYSMVLQRVIQPWDELGVTWNNQPAVDTLHQVYIDESAGSNENYIINVTQLLQDIVSSNKNYGFLLKLKNEQPYSVALFASSDHANNNLHPKLVVYYVK